MVKNGNLSKNVNLSVIVVSEIIERAPDVRFWIFIMVANVYRLAVQNLETYRSVFNTFRKNALEQGTRLEKKRLIGSQVALVTCATAHADGLKRLAAESLLFQANTGLIDIEEDMENYSAEFYDTWKPTLPVYFHHTKNRMPAKSTC